MRIERRRWVIMRNNRTEIFCGLARNYQFKKVDDIGNTAIKNYLSKNKALSAFDNSWIKPDFDVEAVEIIESYETVNAPTCALLRGGL